MKSAVAAVALALLLGACASTPPVAPPAGSQSVSPPVQPQGRWAGRFSVTVTEPGTLANEERSSGRFVLEAANQVTRLELFSPLGQTMARALLDPGGASLVTANGQRFDAASPEELTEQALGWRMPVAELPRWLTATPQAASILSNDADWDVQVSAWRDHRPARLSADWPARNFQRAPRRVNLKLIVDEALPAGTAQSTPAALLSAPSSQ